MQSRTMFLILAGGFLLSACVTSYQPYVSPPPGTPVARLRIVSNSIVTGQVYSGCVAKGNLMTRAGRGGSKESTHTRLDMPPRLAPDLSGVPWLGTKYYRENVEEYLVPAGVPFMLEWMGLSSQTGNFVAKCSGRRHVYFFEENKDYEAYIGMEEERRKCIFIVYRLLPASSAQNPALNVLVQDTPVPIPILLNALRPITVPESEERCKIDARAAEGRRVEEVLDRELQGRSGSTELDAYRAAIAAKIRYNLTPPPGLSGNPKATFEIEQIKIASGGQIVSVKLKQSSGNRALDDAVERAIRKSDPLPLPDNPALFRQKLEITFSPLDEPLNKPEEKPSTPQPIIGADTADATAMDLKLEAEIAERARAYNQRPWRKQVGLRQKEYRFAKYVEYWRMKTERIAELNYPHEARGKMYDSLLVTVSIKKDGSIEKIVINRPSKYPVLNEAVERIVRLGEPYAPFPPEIAKDTDILDITRTWRFAKGRH